MEHAPGAARGKVTALLGFKSSKMYINIEVLKHFLEKQSAPDFLKNIYLIKSWLLAD